jgi:hypothetical protein
MHLSDNEQFTVHFSNMFVLLLALNFLINKTVILVISVKSFNG